MIHTLQDARELATAIEDTLAADGLDVLVTLEPDKATPAVISGIPAIVIAPPHVTNQGAIVVGEYKIPVIGAPVGDQEAAWGTLDTILTSLDRLLEWEDAEPITWQGAQTSTAPAYLLTLTIPTYKE